MMGALIWAGKFMEALRKVVVVLIPQGLCYVLAPPTCKRHLKAHWRTYSSPVFPEINPVPRLGSCCRSCTSSHLAEAVSSHKALNNYGMFQKLLKRLWVLGLSKDTDEIEGKLSLFFSRNKSSDKNDLNVKQKCCYKRTFSDKSSCLNTTTNEKRLL